MNALRNGYPSIVPATLTIPRVPEKLGGAWHHDIDPATFVRAFPKGGCKGFVEPACCHVSTPNGLASEASLEKPAPSGLTGGPLSWLRGLDATYSEPASSYD
jgi:hypothetical protein